MTGLGAIGFSAPWILAALAALPGLWWLLRASPPAPRDVRFPAVRFLFGMTSKRQTPARTPWWLLLLRLLLAAFLIVGLARPLIMPTPQSPPGADGPMLLVIDNGWASGPIWRGLQAAALTLLDQPERTGQPVLMLTTAATLPPHPELKPEPAARVRARLQAMTPDPWHTDRHAALTALDRFLSIGTVAAAEAFWLHDGLEDPAFAASGRTSAPARALAARLAERGPLTVLTPDNASTPVLVLDPPQAFFPVLETRVRRGDPMGDAMVWVRLLDDQGRIVARSAAVFDAGATETIVQIEAPGPGPAGAETGGGSLDISITGEDPLPGAATRVFLDRGAGSRRIGLIRADGGGGDRVPLLDPLYYVEKALLPRGNVTSGPVEALIDTEPAVLVLADLSPVSAPDEKTLSDWIEAGGVLVRFASSRPEDAGTDSLLPVRLRAGDRTLGGALSWSEPAHLAPFPTRSPFADLPIPEDITVTSQVLAVPDPDLDGRTWAYLSDGTPLVTATRRGAGRVIFFHITPTPDWSTLPLSVLFEQMLDRLVATATGGAAAADDGRPLAPWRVVDGLGRLVPPTAADRALIRGASPFPVVRPGQPPGLYGEAGRTIALNLSPSIPALAAVGDWPAQTRHLALDDLDRTRDLSGWFFAVAAVLFGIDFLVTLGLRGRLSLTGFRRQTALSLLGVLATTAWPLSVDAQPVNVQAIDSRTTPSHTAATPPAASVARTVTNADIAAALEPRLAYIATGNPSLDAVNDAGLRNLTALLARRTNAALADPVALDPETDDPLLYPVVYWSVSASRRPLSAAAATRINRYMKMGGLLVIDSRGAPGLLPDLAADLDIPPLQPLDADHVLARSFYLLAQTPGRLDAGPAWVAHTGNDHDGVSPVVIGDNDWVGAWAQGNDGSRQRELAHRFGVNIVMYALTGTYKGDQLHAKALLDQWRN